VAIELLCAAQALDFQGVEKAGEGTRALHARIRERFPHLDSDQPLAPGIERLSAAIMKGEITDGII